MNISRHDIGLALTRSIVGVVFIFHGAQKLLGWWGGFGLEGTAGFFAQIGIPAPYANAVLASTTELVGGLLLVLGIVPRLAALPLAFTMGVAIATVHRGAFSSMQNGMEFPLTLGVVLIGLAFAGGGRLNVLELARALGGQHRATAAALAAA